MENFNSMFNNKSLLHSSIYDFLCFFNNILYKTLKITVLIVKMTYMISFFTLFTTTV